MSNHVHLVVYDKNQNISIAMKSLLVRYVSYFNKKYGRTGNLVQERFFNRNIINKVYLLNVCRYIHQNPEKAQIAHTEDYEWSSYHEFLRNPENKSKRLVNTKLLLNQFSKENMQNAINQFIQFHKEFEKIKDGRDIVEYEMNDKLTDRQLREIVQNLLGIENMSEIKQNYAEKRNEMIEKLQIIKGTSYNQIGRVTGINRKMIERVIKGKKEK